MLDVVFLLDGSSSMSGKDTNIIEEYNRQVEKYKREDYKKNYITTVVFRETCELLQLHMPIRYVQKLDGFHYYSYGNTAYYDSVIEVVELMEELVKERSSSVVSEVLFIIISDGMDNASIWNTKDDLEKIFEKKRKAGWRFIERKKINPEGLKNMFT